MKKSHESFKTEQPNLNDDDAWNLFCQHMDDASSKIESALDILEVVLAANESRYLINRSQAQPML